MKHVALCIAVALTLHCAKAPLSTGGGDVVTTGYLFTPDGRPAGNCSVLAVPADLVPVNGTLPGTAEASTDSSGKYCFSDLVKGEYNIFGIKDSLRSYLPLVEIDNGLSPAKIRNDTLRPAGSIAGTVKLSGSADSRSVVIMGIGTMIVTGPDDTSGLFLLPDLARGYYRIRFLAMGGRYGILDTTFFVDAGRQTNVGTITLTAVTAGAFSLQGL
jgi:hypothetical protein